jgi:hypothetical protein
MIVKKIRIFVELYMHKLNLMKGLLAQLDRASRTIGTMAQWVQHLLISSFTPYLIYCPILFNFVDQTVKHEALRFYWIV